MTGMPKMKVNESTSETPICPHCEKPLDTLSARKVRSRMGVRFVYFCAHCKKMLGVSHRKGFWMG